MAADQWKAAFLSVCLSSDFQPLTELLAQDDRSTGINEASIDWEGVFLTPLFVASLLRLEDQLPQLIAAGADPNAQCFYEGFLCCPLHAAALHCDTAVLTALIEAGADVAAQAEVSAVEGDDGPKLTGCHALHVMIAKDVYSEEVYRLLMGHGLRLSSSCGDHSGLLLPRLLGNTRATEQRLDGLLGEEVRLAIRCAGQSGAHALNDFLEVLSVLRREHHVTYRCASDIDFRITDDGLAGAAQDEEPSTALLFAAQAGSCEAVRLLLYAGADAGRTARRALDAHGRCLVVPAQAVHLAVLRGDMMMVEQLLFFGISPDITCTGQIMADDQPQEEWSGLTLVHLAVLSRKYDLVPTLLQLDCSLEASACTGSTQVTPLHLAVLLEDAKGCASLMDKGAEVSEAVRCAAYERRSLVEMFGGESPISLEDWVSAILEGQQSLRELLDQRTNLNKEFAWPHDAASSRSLLEGKGLSSPELTSRLQALSNGRTRFQGFRPAHLAIILDQVWALHDLLHAGADLGVVREVLLEPLDDPLLQGMDLDPVFLCVRLGTLEMLQQLQALRQEIGAKLPLVPDLTPAFWPWKVEGVGLQPQWAWRGLTPLSYALLRGRGDVALLLLRLGADLLQPLDHIAIEAPKHYSITDNCFRGLTPLHLCALLGLTATANGLLTGASSDVSSVFPGETRPPQAKELLGATCCQLWATLETDGDPEKEPWLWRDLTPLHLALVAKNYETAEALIEVSTPDTLDILCSRKDVDNDTEVSYSALLLAFEHRRKDLHRKIAKRSC
ncbi:unnamed protein product [Effrenium voratum]|uniref:Uncharacterized protein n=1 Tax=Effrenium voratum TaxID=2562239 RepID=A0AA36N1T0_9DINO|nr:unnamed protein product [Effrenium voratum]CAJ1416875.1 unnamed protein product [Effrenium voratum]